MKTVHIINKWSFIVTLVLYLTVYLGMIAQIPLGGIQIILAISFFFKWKKLSYGSKTLLIVYWTLVFVYGALIMIFKNQFYDDWIFSLMILPMSIAAYFVYVTHKIVNPIKP